MLQLLGYFVFAYADCWLSHAAAQYYKREFDSLVVDCQRTRVDVHLCWAVSLSKYFINNLKSDVSVPT